MREVSFRTAEPTCSFAPALRQPEHSELADASDVDDKCLSDPYVAAWVSYMNHNYLHFRHDHSELGDCRD